MLYLPNNSLSVIYKTLPTEASFTTLRYLLKRYLLDKYLFFFFSYACHLAVRLGYTCLRSLTTLRYFSKWHLQPYITSWSIIYKTLPAEASFTTLRYLLEFLFSSLVLSICCCCISTFQYWQLKPSPKLRSRTFINNTPTTLARVLFLRNKSIFFYEYL